MFGENGLRIGTGIEIGSAGKVTMNSRGPRIERVSAAVAVDGLRGSPVFLETISEVIQRIRIAGPDREGLADRRTAAASRSPCDRKALPRLK